MENLFNERKVREGYLKIHKSYWLASVEADKGELSYDQIRAIITSCDKLRENWYAMWKFKILRSSFFSGKIQERIQFIDGMYSSLCVLSLEIDNGFRSNNPIHKLNNKDKYREFIKSIKS